MHRIEIYDTTLRDGAQSEDISFSVEDKLRIAEKLDELGIHYIEGGWPGANPKDSEFFKKARKLRLKNSTLVGFGSTHHAKRKVHNDPNIKTLLKAGTPVVTIFGKSWDFHVKEALRISLTTNLDLINNSIVYLKKHFEHLFFDAEHFFDGYSANPDYAMQVLEAAAEAGADALVLCDTNGGTIPYRIAEVVTIVLEHFPHISIGIHAHNDCEMAVANSLAAARVGARQVECTINGIGERCGNANLISIIPDLQLKMGIDCGISPEQLQQLGALSRFVNEMANRLPWKHQPFVGLNAFAHKGGIHVAAVK
ncbi:MAG: citramalate synthase, partial [Thermodesulfovibrionia bacterium]|nr:citramalate synthase [Thermodesulfovibrionia bacterium]